MDVAHGRMARIYVLNVQENMIKTLLIYYLIIGAVINFLWLLLTMWMDKDLLTKEDLRNPILFIWMFLLIYLAFAIIFVPLWPFAVLAFCLSYGAGIQKI